MLVLDALSRDRTAEFARAAGAEVIERAWTDFLEARRFALSNVRTPWVLMLDADEALDDVLREAIVLASEEMDGYIVRRTTYYCGKPLRMWRGEPLVRLFRTERAELMSCAAAGETAPLHERWSTRGATGELPGRLLHFSYPDVASYRAKFERYTDLEGSAMRFSLLRTAGEWLAIWPRWLYLLLVKRELLDGRRGVVAAYWSARYRYVAARKARR